MWASTGWKDYELLDCGKVPVGGLLGKETGVLEIHGLNIEGQGPIADLPPLGQVLFDPLSPARMRAGIAGIVAFPARVTAGGIPDGLGIRTH